MLRTVAMDCFFFDVFFFVRLFILHLLRAISFATFLCEKQLPSPRKCERRTGTMESKKEENFFLDLVKRAYMPSRRMNLCWGCHVPLLSSSSPSLSSSSLLPCMYCLYLSMLLFYSAFFNRILTRFYQRLQRYCFHVNIMQCYKIVCLHAPCTKRR